MTVKLRGMRQQPLLQPPSPPEYEWAKATASDVEAMNRRLEELRIREGGDGAPELAMLLRNMKLLGVVKSVKRSDLKTLEDYADGLDATDPSGLPAPMPATGDLIELAAGMKSLGIDAAGKGRVKALLAGVGQSVPRTGRYFTEAYHLLRELGVEQPLKPETARLFLEKLEKARKAAAGERVAYILHALGKGGQPTAATHQDMRLMRDYVEAARAGGDAYMTAEMLVMLMEIPLPKAEKKGPDMPPLRRFRG